MKKALLDYIDSVSRYSNNCITAATEFLRSDVPELLDISSITAGTFDSKPWIDAHCESEFSFDSNTKVISEWLNDISWRKIESSNSIRHTWQTDAFTLVLWFWRKK